MTQQRVRHISSFSFDPDSAVRLASRRGGFLAKDFGRIMLGQDDGEGKAQRSGLQLVIDLPQSRENLESRQQACQKFRSGMNTDDAIDLARVVVNRVSAEFKSSCDFLLGEATQ